MSDVQGIIETALDTRLKANSSLTAIIGTNIFEGQAPAKTPLPYVVVTMIDGDDDNDHPARSMEFYYQFDCWAADRATARQVAGVIDDALHQVPLTLSGGWANHWIAGGKQRSFTENIDGTQAYRRMRTFNIKISK